MIWATISSRSCFCWLYRASPSLAAKKIINLILVLTTWWCPCVESACVVGRGCLLWPVHSLGKTLLDFALLHFVFQGQICLLLQVFLGEGNGNPLQYSCLENLMDGGAWWAAISGVAQSWTPWSDAAAEAAAAARYFLTSYFCIPGPYKEKDIFLEC